eukprot:Clim_evm43s246 gene=Clim_evmTU43s246
MSKHSREAVKGFADSLGISLSNEVAQTLVPDLEYRLRDIVQESLKFASHSKRRKLLTKDVNAALESYRFEPLYGFSTLQSKTIGKVHPQMISGGRHEGTSRVTLQDLEFRASHGESAQKSSTTVQGNSDATGTDAAGAGNSETKEAQVSTAKGSETLYFADDLEVSLEDVIKAPTPGLPFDVTWKAHWLAINGHMPNIPENPSVYEDVKRGVINMNKVEEGADSANKTGDSAQLKKNVEVRPIKDHTLSKELQFYFKHVTNGLVDGDTKLCQTALKTLRKDVGLQQLLPYLISFIEDKISANLRNLPMLCRMMMAIDAIVQNESLYHDPYLHKIMPCVLTCLVSKRLCRSAKQDHWTLRRFSAELVGRVCDRYGKQYPNLKPRVGKTLVTALLDPDKAMTSHYGALLGLHALGPLIVQLLIVPNAARYAELLSKRLQDQSISTGDGTYTGNGDAAEEAHRLRDAFIYVVAMYVDRKDCDEDEKAGLTAVMDKYFADWKKAAHSEMHRTDIEKIAYTT